MNPHDSIKARIAKALLSQQDSGKRKRQILILAGALLSLFLAHSYFSNMETPLKLIPQTMTAIGMGYVMLYMHSLRRFPYVAEFIDWAKVKESAEVAPSNGP